ncbi:AAA family ATPase [Telluria beijingensis]|uniref:AAA family ATPase n=1 Tax=Telluria beijingensis TaxID=3068633 RepID=UPI002795DD18|nr:AAA family ATPase [Massilia sp. REN29]
MFNLIKPHVYFAVDKATAPRMKPGAIVIWVPQDEWNDFGHQTLFEYSIQQVNTEYSWRKFRLAFLEDENNQDSEYTVVLSRFKNSKKEILSADEFPRFFSMQSEAHAYREIAEEWGTENCRLILSALNDVVMAERTENQPEWLEAALKSSAFNLSFLRLPQGFFTYTEGYNWFLGDVSQYAQSPPTCLNLHFHLDGFPNQHDFKFLFDENSLLPKRMAAIIGKNGVGKSRTLNELTHAALEQKPNLTDASGRYPQISKVIAVCTPGETEATFPRAVHGNSSIQYVRLSAIPGQRMGGHNETLPLVLQKLAREDARDNSYRWEIFKRSVQIIMDFDDLVVVSSKSSFDNGGSKEEIPDGVRLINLNRGNEMRRLDNARRLDRNGTLARNVNGRYVPLSSGQLSFVRLAAQLCLHMSSGTIVLIDEPETHLHPRLVTEFVQMLNSILEVTNSVAIVATHSAYFVREIPTSQVHIITVAPNGAVQVGTPRLKTFGSDVGAISDFIFEDDAISRLIQDVDLRISESDFLDQNWERQLASELSTEAVMYLKRSQKNRKNGGK